MFNGDAFPDRVDRTDVRHVETLTSALRALDREYGGGACRDACVAVLNWATPLLDAGSVGRAPHRLQVAIADLHNLAGWASFDMGLLESAHLHFGRAMGLARASGNCALEANIHYRMGRVHLHHELAEDALASFRRGLPIARDSGSTLAMSILHANEAWALAKLGAERQALRQFACAEDEFARARTEDAPPWARFFDLADLVSIGGMVHTELARTCDVRYARSAIPLLTKAISSGGEDTSRSQSFRLAALAMNHLVRNEPEQALEVGEQAIAVSGPIRSARTRDRMRPLEQEAVRLRGNEAADQLASSLGRFMTSSQGAA